MTHTELEMRRLMVVRVVLGLLLDWLAWGPQGEDRLAASGQNCK